MNFLVSVIQLNSSDNIGYNIKKVIYYCEESIKLGAELITLPEYTFQLTIFEDTTVWDEGTHPGIKQLEILAHKHKVWIHGGSVTERIKGGSIVNRSYFISNKGIEGFYDKIHLFSASLGDNNQYNESSFYTAGSRVSTVTTPWGKMGLTICFDLRFPSLYQELLKRGVGVIIIPAAFTYVTGKAHWLTLIRARAIETQCFVIAPAQCGTHSDGKRTYGHSLIVNPWGEILNEAGEEEGLLTFRIDLKQLDYFRKKINLKYAAFQ